MHQTRPPFLELDLCRLVQLVWRGSLSDNSNKAQCGPKVQLRNRWNRTYFWSLGFNSGPELFWELLFFCLGIFWFPVLSAFPAICSILELKAAISMAFATFRSSNLGVCKVLVLQLFMSHGILQLLVGFIKGWFRVYLGLVLAYWQFRVGFRTKIYFGFV